MPGRTLADPPLCVAGPLMEDVIEAAPNGAFGVARVGATGRADAVSQGTAPISA